MTPDPAPIHQLDNTSDQELVDLYIELADTFWIDAGPSQVHRIQQAASAAHALESRGYVEQSGVWTHEQKPHIRATA